LAISGRPASSGVSAPSGPGARIRCAAVGISVDDPCGVRDHARLLGDQLAAVGVSCRLHWLSRSEGSIGDGRAEVHAWADAVAGELEREPPDAILLHYSVFAFSHRGVPMFVRPVLAALAGLGIPCVTFMHEYAYPWHLGGARGKVWALTQRAALRAVVRRSSAIVVSADARANWLATRVWLPRRPTSVAPVFSNLPPAADAMIGAVDGAATLGLFGYGHEGVGVTTVLDALRIVRERHSGVELLLLGAPGSPSLAAARWNRAAAERGLTEALRFSGTLPAQDLSDQLAACEVLLFAEQGGPTSRKTTLAASLSSGRPVVALDGHSSWAELLQQRAAAIVEPDAAALARTIIALLADGEAREQQGRRGREFAARTMSVEHSAQVMRDALARSIGGASR
jgi:glycosyltransferase involved in cell wall biosynthesis